MLYQAALRNELHQRLGVGFDEPNEHDQAEPLGAPTALLTLWSKRGAAIDAEAARKSLNTKSCSAGRCPAGNGRR